MQAGQSPQGKVEGGVRGGAAAVNGAGKGGVLAAGV